jgi:hypothetical protein
VSGTKASWPEFNKFLDHLCSGGEAVVWKLDRPGPNTRSLLALMFLGKCTYRTRMSSADRWNGQLTVDTDARLGV